MGRFPWFLGTLLAVGGCHHLPGPQPDPPHSADFHPMTASPHGSEVSVQPLQKELEGTHPVDFYLQLALQRNPEIQASEKRVAAQSEKIPQVTTLPDPMIRNTIWPDPMHSPQTASGRMTNSFMLSQALPWFGKLRLRGEVADLETQMALTQLVQSQLKVIESVKLAYYDIYYSQRAIQITQETEKLLRDLYIPAAEINYKTGKVSQQDVIRAQLELSKIQEQLIPLRKQLKEAQADLARQLSATPETDLRAASTLDLPPVPQQLDYLYQMAAATRPELKERWLAIARDQRQIELAKLNYFPDVTVGFNWDPMTRNGSISPVADGFDNLGFSVSFNLPVRYGKYNAGVREALNQNAASSKMFDVTRDETFQLVRRLTVQARALEEQIQLYRKDLIPKAKQTFDISLIDYRVGKVDSLQVISNWTEWLRFQIQEARLEAMLGQTLASLERVMGLQLAAMSPQGGNATQGETPRACLGAPLPATLPPPAEVPGIQAK